MSLASCLRLASRRAVLHVLPLAALALASASCAGGRDAVDDELSAELAYRGLDRAVDRIIKLGFDGFNAANSANIPPQSEAGDLSGTMDVTGQVDQGNSANKGMRLDVVLSGYSDGPPSGSDLAVIYDGGPASVDLSMKGLPDADLSGTLTGTFVMDGDLLGDVALDLAITGKTQDAGGGVIARVPGTIHVVGTASSDYGVFNVDVSL